MPAHVEVSRDRRVSRVVRPSYVKFPTFPSSIVQRCNKSISPTAPPLAVNRCPAMDVGLASNVARSQWVCCKEREQVRGFLGSRAGLLAPYSPFALKICHFSPLASTTLYCILSQLAPRLSRVAR